MATNPQALGQTKISFQISEEEKAELQRLADASKMKLSAYIRQVLVDAIAQEASFATYRTASQPVLMAAEEQAPYGTKPTRKGKGLTDKAS